MRAAIVVALLVAGCSSSDPCAGKSGSCIGLRIVGSIATLDQLAFTIKPGSTATERTPTPARTLQLPVKVAVFPPAGTTGTVHVSAEAFASGTTVGHGSVDALLVNGRAQATLTLVAAAAEGDMTAAASDLAGADLAGRDLAGADLAACANVTACMGGDGCCPSTCNAGNDNDCTAACGNGRVDPGELCDDGNTVNGDGCDPTCSWLGQMSTLSGIAGGCGYADGAAARFYGGFGGVDSDGVNYYVSSGLTIRRLSPTSPSVTLLGAPFDARFQDGDFSTARIHGGDNFPIPVLFLPNNSNLYFADYNGTARVLREVDLVKKTVTSIATTVVQNNPIALTVDINNTTIFYIGSAGDVNKWTVGDVSSTQIVSGAAINTAMGATQSCTSISRSQSNSWLACGWGIIQVTDAGVISVVAGQKNMPGCSDNANLTMASFTGATSIRGGLGDALLTSCDAIRQVRQTGVTTVAGELGNSGYRDGPAASALFSNSLQYSGSSGVITDGSNCVVRYLSNGMVTTIAGAAPATAEIRGTATASRYRVGDGLVTDGTYAYLLGQAVAGPTNVSELVSINLANGTSADLFKFSSFANAITLIGSELYVAIDDGTIHRISTTGTNDAVLVGTAGTTSPPSDGTPGMLNTAVLNPKALTTDGTDLYFFDGAKLVRKVSLSTATVSLVAGTAGTSDVVDDGGAKAHFANQFADVVFARGNLYVSDGLGAGSSPYPNVIRQVKLSTGQVTTIAGQLNNFGDSDGVGLQAQLAAAPFMATDGRSLFISDAGPPPILYAARQLQPTIRQLDLNTLSLTTMVGQRGLLSILNGTGIKAIVHHPAKLAFDATTHAIYFIDREEGVIQTIH